MWGNAKKSNVSIIQTFQNITLRKLTNISPYISNYTLLSDRKPKKLMKMPNLFKKKFYNRLGMNKYPLIKYSVSDTIPGNPSSRLIKLRSSSR